MCWRSLVGVLIALFFMVPSVLAGTFVADIQVQGNKRVDSAIIKNALSITPGQEISIEDVNRDIRAIFRLDQFEDVQASILEINGLSTLVFTVKEKDLIRKITFQGNKKLGRDALTKASELTVPFVFDREKVLRSVDQLRAKYRSKAYWSAIVKWSVDDSFPGASELIFEIEEGKKAHVKKIRFDGNKQVSEDELKEAMQTKEKGFLSFLTGTGTYLEEMVAVDVSALENVYKNHGFLQVKVRQPIITPHADGRSLDLLFEIEEGRQYFMGSIEVRGEFAATRQEILDRITLKKDEVFDRSQLRKSIVAVNDLLADRGYAYVNVSPLLQIRDSDQRVDIALDIEQGEQVYINRINISGNETTLDKVVRREVQLQEGDLYNATKLKRTRNKIRNTGYFEEVGVSTKPTKDLRYTDINVEVTEQSTGNFSIGGGYDTAEGFVATASLMENNFLGHGLRVIASGSIGEEDSTYRIGITDPYFLDYNLTAGAEIYKTESEWDEFTRAATGVKLKLGWGLNENWRNTYIYNFESKDISEIDTNAAQEIKDFEGKSTLSSLTAAFVRDTRDYRLEPKKGSLSRLSLEVAGLGGDDQFVKGLASYRHFFPLKWDTVFTAHTQIGHVFDYGDDGVPIDERFYLGGMSTLRGFDTREVGPKSGNSFIGGDTQAYANFDYIFHIHRESAIRGVLFFDVGNAWSDVGDFGKDLRYSAGFELLWKSPFGPFRVGYGFNLAPEGNEESGQVLFSFGTFY